VRPPAAFLSWFFQQILLKRSSFDAFLGTVAQPLFWIFFPQFFFFLDPPILRIFFGTAHDPPAKHFFENSPLSEPFSVDRVVFLPPFDLPFLLQ